MRLRLKLYGVFRSTARSGEIVLELPEKAGTTVRYAIGELIQRDDLRDLRSLLVSGDTSDPRPNALIIVSGREIGALNGLETELKDNDELALLPVAHGG
ncbi:MAG TPA: MoaD/ThiS family protein [Candidatus Bathyarchaeia archaeon]|nr:MoaD/ThiS family protein [Candidatus Bathyarchaeia archaeon]HKM78625.1 MoaD/ThiS family protein [Candidatus Bathyarchaeia archaeon]